MSRVWGFYCVNKSKKAKCWNEEVFSVVPQRILKISFWRHCWQTNSSKIEWVSRKWIRHVKPPIDSKVLLLHGMSEKSVILHQEITLTQADTESVVDSAGTHFALSINLHVPLIEKNVVEMDEQRAGPGGVPEQFVVRFLRDYRRKMTGGTDFVWRCCWHHSTSTICVVRLFTLSLNSRCHVVAILSARGEEARFRMRVTLGVILIRSLVYTKHIPGRLRSGSGVVLD